ncbi:MAG: hypothetical protein OCC49_01625 [Fibrobacterales bacterium]
MHNITNQTEQSIALNRAVDEKNNSNSLSPESAEVILMDALLQKKSRQEQNYS